MTTATHAALLVVVIKTANVENGLKEIRKERSEARKARRRLDVDDVFHY